MRDTVFFLIWVALFPISLWSAHIGVLLWIWTALIAPGTFLYGFAASIPYNKIVAIVTIVVLIVNKEKNRFYMDSTVVLFALIALVATISANTAIVSSHDGWFYYEKLLKILVLAFVVTGIMWSRWRIHAAVLAICLAFGFDGMNDGLKFLVSGGGHKITGKQSVGDNNHLALAVLITIPLLLYACKQSSLRIVKICFAIVSIGCVVTVIGSFSRGAFLGLVVMGGMFLKNSRSKAISFILVVVAVGLIMTLAPESWFSRVDTINAAGEDSSFMGRIIAWKISTLVALDRPFGGGFHAILNYSVWMRYGGDIATLDFIETAPPGDVPRAAHSIYFEILGDLGFIGLLLFLALIIVGFKNAILLKRYARFNPQCQWAADLGGAIQISLVVYCVSGAALSMAYFETFYVLLAILSRARRSVRMSLADREAMVPIARFKDVHVPRGRKLAEVDHPVNKQRSRVHH